MSNETPKPADTRRPRWQRLLGLRRREGRFFRFKPTMWGYALLLGCKPSVCTVAGHIIAARALAGTGDWETLPRLSEVPRHLTEAAVGAQ